MPDPLIDRVIRSAQVNRGTLSNALAREVPVLTEPGVWDDIVQAVTRALGSLSAGNVVDK
jgi:hypothetical protein